MQHRGRTLVLSRDRLPTLLDDERTLVLRRPPRAPELVATEPDLRRAYQAPIAEPAPPPKGPPNVVLLSKIVIAAYRVTGFAVLTAVLFGLGCYVVVTLFYLANRSWIAPTILSPADPRVLALSSQAVGGEAQKERLAATRSDMGARLVFAEAELDARLAELRRAVDSFADVLAAMESSPSLRAPGHGMTVAFVPYENAGNVRKGDPIYGCKMGLVWCKKVGVVGSILDGEVLGRHPLRNTEVRGIFVEMTLDDASWAKEAVLHVGRAPLLL